jgi:tetrahydromethanopterin S-methyltransferase subunit H
MFVFKKEQQAFDFGGVTIGGQPGQNPTVLIGGLFFQTQPIVKNAKEGTFDEQMAREWIDTANMMVDKTGHPLIIQAFARTAEAMERHLSWLADNFEGPFMFESTSADARRRAIQFCDQGGLGRRAIYNSINLSMKEEEKALLRNSPIIMAVVLGWSPRATGLADRMETIKAMISEAKSMGMEKIVVDPATMPVGAGYGLEYRTMLAIKSELGLPTCLGPHNAPSAWKFIKQPGLDDETTQISAVVASTVAAQLFATDCIMYGSMARSKQVFTAVSLIANAMAAAVAEAQQAIGVSTPIFEPKSFE